MNLFATIILLGAIPGVVCLFGLLGGRRASILSLLGGYLFLPPGGLEGFGFVPITRETCMSIGLLLGVLLCDGARLRELRLSRWDLLLLTWCLVPIASSLTNDLGLYDGVSTATTSALVYGVPYLVGRMYVRDGRDFTALGVAIALAGIIYIPFCWFEIRMSPQLNRIVYGFDTQAYTEMKRFGGWRPAVFMQHGLAVALWMAVATVLALVNWRARKLPRIAGFPGWFWVGLLGLTTIFCASAGAIVLLAIGSLVALLCLALRSRTPLLALALVSPVYLAARVVFDWRPDALVDAVEQVDASRAGSLQVRVESDTAFRDHAMKRPWFGWGGWGRGTSIAYAPDSFFGIALSKHGIVGLVGIFGSWIAAQLLPLRRMRRSGLAVGEVPGVMAIVLALAMYTIDCLLNGMLSWVFTAASGALIGWGVTKGADPGVPARRRRDLPR